MNKDGWFRDWFDSEYYHLLYNKRDDSEADFFINNICKYLQLNPSAKIWDLACGKGRHTLAFGKKGFSVTGTDLAKNSIKTALETEEPNVEFFVHDMRRPFRVNYFDCVVNLFTSIGYFDRYNDNFLVFDNVYSSLKPGGIFVVDFFNAEKVKETLLPEYTEQRDDVTFHITKCIANNIIHKKINFEHRLKKFEFEETVSLLKKEDFEKFAEKSGFTLQTIFGNYALEPFNEKTSDRLILLFKK
ncbi:MAG: class I SAM-dependent methyltransferase [Bacteroidetes bacterium]|nr:class I SAM-dependent methyltransferase [Bacteroidota bacterium]